jgi:16S rRNA (guanine527-N7)-methyltransferase
MSDLLFSPETLDKPVVQKLKTLEVLLQKWNKNLNLVSTNSSNNIWSRHITDCLQLIPFLGKVYKLADMGTGVGLPSIPLAITCPDINIFAIEHHQKKTALLSQITRELAIPNIHVLSEKVESVIVSHMDVVCCRAFGEFIRDAGLAYKMLKPGGKFMTFKANPEDRTPNGFRKPCNHKYRLMNYSKDFFIVVTQKLGDLD